MDDTITETVLKVIEVLSSEVCCPHCPAEFPIGTAIRESTQDEKDFFTFVCPVCGSTITMMGDTITETVLKVIEVFFSEVCCPLCSTRLQIRQAIRELTQDEKVYFIFVCPVCEMEITEIRMEVRTHKVPKPLPAEKLVNTIIAFINSDSWHEGQRIVEQHPELLLLETDSLMKRLAMTQEDKRLRLVVEEHRVLLAHCREVGVERAFAEKINPPPEIVGQAIVIAFISADSWQKCQRIVEQHPQLLLIESDYVMQKLAMALEDKRLRRVVEERRMLLARCREVGVGQAFAEKRLATSSGPEADTVQPQRLETKEQRDPHAVSAETIITFISADSWDEYRRILEQHPELLSPETDSFMEAITKEAEDEEAKRFLQVHLQFLARCRQVGVEQAIAEMRSMIPSGFESDIVEAEQLETQGQRDPRAFGPLVKLYERVLGRLRPGEHPAFRATIQYQLGHAYANLPTGDRGANLEKAIGCYEEALRFRTPEAAPLDYAAVQHRLGVVYRNLPTGDPGENLMQAIKCYEEALRFRTPEAAPLDYAATQNNLGNAYRDLPTGERRANLLKAIECYEEALRFHTPEAAPLDYAATQNNLGNAYSDLPTADPRENLAQAIKCYEEALRFWEPQTTPVQYAMAQNNLGLAYRNLPTADPRENLAQAIKCYEEALRFRTPEAAPLDYAATQNNLGTAYSDLPTGDREAHLMRAIVCYEQALRFWTPESAPLDYARAQNNLGTAYRSLPTGDRGENLARAVEFYQEALRFRTPQAAPLGYAATQSNLGIAYRDLPTGDRGENLARAIACFEEALTVCTPEAAPLDYAMTQNSLGTAYRSLPTGDRGENLARAVEFYQEALRFCTPEAAPLDYATTQNLLGESFLNLPTGDRSANLAQAIGHFQEALRIYTPETTPLEYAMTQNNLGVAYRQLPTGDVAANVTRAIECFQRALRFHTPETAPLDYARTQNNLGGAYMSLPTSDRRTNLEKAIECLQEALRFLGPESMPSLFAMAQFNLGSAYFKRLTGNVVSNVVSAANYYKQALRVYTPEAAPFEYANVQTGLTGAYAALSAGYGAEYLEKAIESSQEALRFHTPEAAPHECRMANRNIAELCFEWQDWDSALASYRAAMDVGERLYRAGLSGESKAAEVAENATLYHHAAFAAASLGDTAQALLTLERGKTRLLAEALRMRVPRPGNVPDEVWVAFEQAGAKVRSVHSAGTATPHQGPDTVQAYNVRVQAAREANAALEVAIERVREYTAHFLKEINLPAIQTLTPDAHTALVAFCMTDQGSMGFIVSQNHDEAVQVVDVPGFTTATLSTLIQGHEGSWIEAYMSKDDTRWHSTIERVLAEVGEKLLTPVLAALPSNIERLVLLPSGGLFLLPLHAAPLSDNDSDRVCDRYQVSYAPSVEVLGDCQTKAARASGHDLYAAINPEEDARLVFTPTEGTAIAGLFAGRKVHEGRAGTKEAVVEGVRGRAYLHLSCHGVYNWNDPPESGLTLADGRLTLAELQSGDVDMSAARLVTLSACETGLTDVVKGSAEEYVGLPAGFMLAGVPCVVSSLWSVPDLSTALLMERFYNNHLNDEMDFAAALHEAQLWVRDLEAEEVADYAEQCYQQSDEKNRAELFKYRQHYRYLAEKDSTCRPFEHPYYWAAFTVNGM